MQRIVIFKESESRRFPIVEPYRVRLIKRVVHRLVEVVNGGNAQLLGQHVQPFQCHLCINNRIDELTQPGFERGQMVKHVPLAPLGVLLLVVDRFEIPVVFHHDADSSDDLLDDRIFRNRRQCPAFVSTLTLLSTRALGVHDGPVHLNAVLLREVRSLGFDVLGVGDPVELGVVDTLLGDDPFALVGIDPGDRT